MNREELIKHMQEHHGLGVLSIYTNSELDNTHKFLHDLATDHEYVSMAFEAIESDVMSGDVIDETTTHTQDEENAEK